MSRVFVSRFKVNQLHEGFSDCKVDEVYVGHAVLGASSMMRYGVGCGLIGVALSLMMAMGVGYLSLVGVAMWYCCVGAC
jgi:hypothetical protein